MTQESEILIARLDERYKALDHKLDTIIKQGQETKEKMDTHDTHLQQLFQWRSEVKGGWKATTALGASVGAVIGGLIGIFFKND